MGRGKIAETAATVSSSEVVAAGGDPIDEIGVGLSDDLVDETGKDVVTMRVGDAPGDTEGFLHSCWRRIGRSDTDTGIEWRISRKA